MNDVYHQITWDTARIAGMLAFVLLTASVCLGLVLSLKVRSRSWPRFVTDGLHRHVTLIALVFTAIHTLAVWLDPFTAFTPAEVFVPFASHYRPLWIGLGIVAAYLLVAVWASEWIRPRIGYAWWRRLHYVSFALFVFAALHGIGAGSDTATSWGFMIYAVGVGAVVLLLGWRLWVAVAPDWRAPSLTILAAAAFVLALWTLLLPMQPGWNAIANNGNGDGRANGVAAPQPASDQLEMSLPIDESWPGDGHYDESDGDDEHEDESHGDDEHEDESHGEEHEDESHGDT